MCLYVTCLSVGYLSVFRLTVCRLTVCLEVNALSVVYLSVHRLTVCRLEESTHHTIKVGVAVAVSVLTHFRIYFLLCVHCLVL